MGSRNPDFATLTEAALAESAFDSADKLLAHVDVCTTCIVDISLCRTGRAYKSDYRTKKDKALKAIRGRKK